MITIRSKHMTTTVSYVPYGHGLAIIIPRWLTYILSDKTALKIKRFGVNDLSVAPLAFRYGWRKGKAGQIYNALPCLC